MTAHARVASVAGSSSLPGDPRLDTRAVRLAHPDRGICDEFLVSPKTVETHVNAIFGKLGLLPAQDEHRRALAVLAYLRA